MDKFKILSVLDKLMLSSCGGDIHILKPFKACELRGYTPNYLLIEEYLGIKDDLVESGLALADMVKFVFDCSADKALRYLSAVLEQDRCDIFDLAKGLYTEALKVGSSEFNKCVSDMFKGATSLDNILSLYKVLVSAVNSPGVYNASLITSIELSNYVSLRVLKNRGKAHSWYCNVDVKNNYSIVNTLSKEELRLRGLLE